MYCVLTGLKKLNLFKIKIFFQNVQLGDLITNHRTCNYPLCTVTELFGLVTSKCIGVFWDEEGGSKKFFVVQNRNIFFFRMFNSASWSRITPLVTIHHVPLLSYLDLWLRNVLRLLGGLKNFFVQNRNFCFSEYIALWVDYEYCQLKLFNMYRYWVIWTCIF